MSSITLRRCVVDKKTNKTAYDGYADEAVALGDTALSGQVFGKTFEPTKPDSRGNIRFAKLDGAPFRASFIAEIGSLEQGTWLSAQPKNLPPAHKLPFTDANSKSLRMILALRCPTGAPEELRTQFRNGVAVCDSIRPADEIVEAQHGQSFYVTESIFLNDGEGDPTDNITMHVRLHPTFEVSYTTTSSTPPTPRRRITKVGEDATSSDDVVMEGTMTSERKISDTYPTSKLPEIKGALWALDRAHLIQRDYKDVDGTLIAPHELTTKLTEGTLVLVMVELVTYVITDQKPGKKIYHILADKLRILDHGNGEPWTAPGLEPSDFTLASPAKRPRDEAADNAFDNFGSRLSPSPSPRKRAGNSRRT
ncbi:ATP-dependent DNA helicase [Mycena venus]|uniref:ATP-dependent DNA helicase n=1 Tax=Mycena venus TaxID=2733690 RepID=A0A8H7DHQ7_9AGAR|nr:ATP-dependent DNA helicase [Mycena venus]